MRTFQQLQNDFSAYQATAIGLSPDTMRTYQSAQLPTADGDGFLWGLLNQLPSAGPVQQASAPTFFEAYATVVNALIAGNNVLDPVAAAKRNLADWGSQPPAWMRGYKSMTKQLGAAPRYEFSFELAATPAPDIWGLWSGAEPAAGASVRFAASALGMATRLGHVLNFNPQASDWYTSSAMSVAYANPGRAPWDPQSPITWDSTFGKDGVLSRVTTGLICVSDLEFSCASGGSYPLEEQAEILANAASGLWPYYLDTHNSTTSVRFIDDDNLRMTVGSRTGRPMVIGIATQTAAQYFGGQ